MPAVPTAWVEIYPELRTLVEAIPGQGRFQEARFRNLLAGTTVLPTEAPALLAEAATEAGSRPCVRNPRAYAIGVLSNEDFAEAMREQVRLRQAQAIPEPQAEPQATAVATGAAEFLIQEGLKPGGASEAARAVVAAGVAQETLPFLLEVLRETVGARVRQDRVRNPEGFLVHLLRNLDKQTINLAKSRQEAARERWRAVESMGPRVGSLLAGFQAFPGAMDALGTLALAQERLQAAGSDAPGHLDLFDASTQAQNAVIGVARQFLGEEVVQVVEAEVEGRLRGGGLAPGTMVWDRAWKHHLGGAILGRVGVRHC
jgi:hypothetical protein